MADTPENTVREEQSQDLTTEKVVKSPQEIERTGIFDAENLAPNDLEQVTRDFKPEKPQVKARSSQSPKGKTPATKTQRGKKLDAKAPDAGTRRRTAKKPATPATEAKGVEAKAPTPELNKTEAGQVEKGKAQAKSQAEAVDPHSLGATPLAPHNTEAFMTNLARTVEQAGKAAAAWLEPREKGEVQDTYGDTIRDVSNTLSKVANFWMSDPQRALAAQTQLFGGYMNLWQSSVRKMSGEETEDVISPAPGDKRFRDEQWENNELFSFLKQAYLLTSKWAGELVEQTDGLDDHTKHKATFYTQQVMDLLSPTNFPTTNPEVLRETLESDGENLVRGMKLLTEDLQAGKGKLRLRQTDTSKYEVGVDMANTPGKVVSQNDVCQVIQYSPTTEKVLKRPLVIVPPWINKFYILDLNPKKSFIKWAVDHGHTVFVVSWVNPAEKQAGKSFEHYANEGIIHTLDVVEEITGEKEMNMIGYCVGGTLLAATLAQMAETGDKRAASVTFFTTQIDFTYAGDLLVFVDEEQISRVENSMAEKGYLEGARMANAFNMLRSRDLIWPYVVNNYMRGKEPLPFDLLYWNSDATRMPAANHSFYLRNCYLENNLTAGRMKFGDHTLDLSKVNVPVYNLATKEDHIAPAKSAFLGTQFMSGPVDFVLTGSGHIAGVVNPPADDNGGGKYQFWTGGKNEGEFEDWFANAKETPGSWWCHWNQWIRDHDDAMVDPREVGSKDHPPIEDAPGSYVKEKA